VSSLLPQLRHFLLNVDAHQVGEIAAEDFLFGLGGQLWITIAGNEVFWYLELPEGVQGPARVPDGRFATIEDFVLAAPEHQFAQNNYARLYYAKNVKGSTTFPLDQIVSNVRVGNTPNGGTLNTTKDNELYFAVGVDDNGNKVW
jgi:hypothetical protein